MIACPAPLRQHIRPLIPLMQFHRILSPSIPYLPRAPVPSMIDSRHLIHVLRPFCWSLLGPALQRILLHTYIPVYLYKHSIRKLTDMC